MPRNEDGEFELILGNRQLLSVFFIVVVLFGVFFAMGYIVGRSSAPAVTADAGGSARPASSPIVVDSAAPSASTPPASSDTGAPTSTAPQQPAETGSETAPAPPPHEPPRRETKAEPPKAQPEKTETAKNDSKAKAKTTRPEGEPRSGSTYLQLSATQKAEAEVMVDVLRKKGFPAIAAQVPEKPGLYRVLVGPVSDGALNKTRADLQGAGFPGDKAIRKTF